MKVRLVRRVATIWALSMLASPVGHRVSAQPVPGSWHFLSAAPDAGGVRLRHDDVFFLDHATGWVVNLRGQVWMTGDAGSTWTKTFDNGGEVGFRSVGFADAELGWAGSVLNPGSVLFETTDGGVSWTEISNRIVGPVPTGVCGIHAVDQQVVYGAGVFHGDPHIIRSLDGGATWTSQNVSSVAKTLVDIHFVDTNVGFAVGGTGIDLDGNAVVLRTVDGGENWHLVYESRRDTEIDGEWGWKISFPTRMVGYVSVEYLAQSAGYPAKVLKTIDGGLTWFQLTIPGSTEVAGLQGIGFLTPELGWASGRGTTSVTTDGGSSWAQIQHYSPANPDGQLDGAINRIFVVSDTLAFAVGRRVYKFKPGVSTSIDRRLEYPAAFSLEQNYPNPFSPSTTIRYQLHARSNVRLQVYDVIGRHVRSLVNAEQSPGSYEVSWDGRDDIGRKSAPGTYMYLIDAGEAPEMKRMVLIR